MAIKDIIGPGIGFTPGSVKYIVTRGLAIAEEVGIEAPGIPYSVGRMTSVYQATGRVVSAHVNTGRMTQTSESA